MTQLSVNLNKVALLRNSRGHNWPNVEQVAHDCVKFGADGITLHPRPDRRHALEEDVFALTASLPVELNVEGFPSDLFLQMVEKANPAQCTLVPDPPEVLTSNAGWNTKQHKYFLLEVIQRLQEKKIRTSIFIETDLDMIEAAREIGTDRIELYTEPYAAGYAKRNDQSVTPFARAAEFAHELGLGINAGHDLNLANLKHFVEQVPHLAEVSIGHALISDALYLGLEETIKRYLNCLGK